MTNDVETLLLNMLKKYDVVEVKKIHDKLEFIGIKRKLEVRLIPEA